MSLTISKYLIILASIIFFSCSSYRSEMIKAWETEDQLNSIDFGKISGRYSNVPSDHPNSSLLWTLLTNDDSEPSDIINIEFQQDKFIFTREVGGEAISTQKYKYKIIGKHIEIGTQHSINGPLFPLFWVLGTDDFSFGNTSSGNLSVYRVANGTLLLVFWPIFGAGGGPGMVYEFHKMNQSGSNH
jgi:hypothetical protein